MKGWIVKNYIEQDGIYNIVGVFTNYNKLLDCLMKRNKELIKCFTNFKKNNTILNIILPVELLNNYRVEEIEIID